MFSRAVKHFLRHGISQDYKAHKYRAFEGNRARSAHHAGSIRVGAQPCVIYFTSVTTVSHSEISMLLGGKELGDALGGEAMCEFVRVVVRRMNPQ